MGEAKLQDVLDVRPDNEVVEQLPCALRGKRLIVEVCQAPVDVLTLHESEGPLVASPAPLRPSGTGAADGSVGSRLRPARLVHLVHRVEQDKVLHVRVLLELRRLERLLGAAVRRDRSARRVWRAGAVRSDEQPLRTELVDEPTACGFELGAGRFETRCERIDDALEV